jgi:hypothetical protein
MDAVFTGVFASIFKVLPDAIFRRGDALIGAVLTSLQFALGKSDIGRTRPAGPLERLDGTATGTSSGCRRSRLADGAHRAAPATGRGKTAARRPS